MASPGPRLLITADDYGYSPGVSAGILEAAGGGAIDAAGAMVGRPWCDPGPLLGTGVEIGLHLELPAEISEGEAGIEVERQMARFERLFGTAPVYIDGHHHCHARAEVEPAVAEVALDLGARVRSIDEGHRARLRAGGLRTPDRLVGRLRPEEALVPEEIAAVEGGGSLPAGLTEWMVHPGLRDPSSGSGYDEAREEDLRELLRLARDEFLRELRR